MLSVRRRIRGKSLDVGDFAALDECQSWSEMQFCLLSVQGLFGTGKSQFSERDNFLKEAVAMEKLRWL